MSGRISNQSLENKIKITTGTTTMNNIYEYFETVQGYVPVAFIIGSPTSNTYCTGFNKCDWVDSDSKSKVYVAWFTDKVGSGLKYKVVWIKE